MSERSLFGLRIACAGDPAALVPVEALLAGTTHIGEGPSALRNAACDVTVSARAAVAGPDMEGYRAVFFHGRLRGLEKRGSFLLIDGDSYVHVSADGRALDVFTGPRSDPSFARITVFVGLAIALRHHGLFHLHAGALGNDAGTCALVMGVSGAGKSTVTLAMAAAAMAAASDPDVRVLGDDALFLDGRCVEPVLVGLPRPFHLGVAALAAFPELPSGPPDPAGKRPVPFSAVPGRSIAQLGSPQLVLFPEVTADPVTGVSPLAAADTFGRALYSAALVAVDGMPRAEEQLKLLARLLAGARAYEVRLGRDLLSHPAQVARRLWDLARAA